MNIEPQVKCDMRVQKAAASRVATSRDSTFAKLATLLRPCHVAVRCYLRASVTGVRVADSASVSAARTAGAARAGGAPRARLPQ